jgi:glycerophosphoryl diester phosphodiesterase
MLHRIHRIQRIAVEVWRLGGRRLLRWRRDCRRVGHERRLSTHGEVGRFPKLLGSGLHFAHRFVEGLLELALKARAELLDLAVGLPETTHRVGQFLGAEDDERKQQDENDFAPAEIEHGAQSRSIGIPFCIVQQRLPSLIDDPIAFAHRGARAHAPENTLDSFALALKLGATGLESDVWMTADGVAVLDHDGTVAIRRRKRAIAELERRQLPAHIPSLAELIERCGIDYALSLDLKDPRSGEAVVAVTEALAPAMLERLWLCSPEWQTLLPLRDRGVRLVDSTRLSRIKEGPERRAATLASNGIDAINMHHTDWTGGLVALFHRFDRIAFGWDMQFDEVLRPALRMGLDGVYSDWVDRMMDAYRSELGAPRRGS